MNPPRRTARSRTRGFSLVEMACVSAMGVSLFGAAVLAFRSLSLQQNRSTHYGSVAVGAANLQNFYNLPNSPATINTWFTPNYGRSTRAEELRELFHSDVEAAAAVFALPRAGRCPTRLRVELVGLPARTPGLLIDTPAAFLTVLAAFDPSAATTFSTHQGLPPATASNATVYIIQPSLNSEPNQLTVRCLWEIDFVPTPASDTTPQGTYATVRRYVGAKLSHYYDAFYKNQTPAFGPVFTHFERAARATPGTPEAAFKKAAGHSFYFLWWPDPAAPTLRPHPGLTPTDLGGASIPAGDFREGYAQHYGQTSLFFVVPMFPCIQ